MDEVPMFESFNGANGTVCPVCKTAKQAPTILVPIPDTEKNGNVKARQVHRKCYEAVMEMIGD